MWYLAVTAAAAGPPAVTVEADGTVVATVVLGASPDAVRAVLADPAGAASLSDDVRSVEVESTDGRCARLRKQTRGILRPFHLRTVRCPTERGWREDLVESSDFDAFSTEWVVAPEGAGTRVEYRVRTDLRVPVPDAALRAGLEDAVRQALVNLEARVR